MKHLFKDTTTSKKFLAAMRFTRDWTILIVLTLGALGIAAALEQPALAAGMVSVLIAEIIMLGFMQSLYLGGQAAVDTFVRIAVVIITGKASAGLDGKPLTDHPSTFPDPPHPETT